MRGYKFKAWVPPVIENGEVIYTGCMIDVLEIDFERRKIIYFEPFDLLPMVGKKEELGFDEVELLLYTGLSDKNGNELWESDIIENEHKERYLIVWDGTGFKASLNGSEKAIYSANEYWFKSCKKIGNKLENPELLKEESEVKHDGITTTLHSKRST